MADSPLSSYKIGASLDVVDAICAELRQLQQVSAENVFGIANIFFISFFSMKL